MSLFERIQNKRKDLQEKKIEKKFNNNSNSNSDDNVKTETQRNKKINKKLSQKDIDTINRNRQQYQDLQKNKDSGISQLNIKKNPNQKQIKVNRPKTGRGTVKMGSQLNIFTGKPELEKTRVKYTTKPKPNVPQTPPELSGPLFDQQPRDKKGFKSFLKSPAYYARQRAKTDAGRKRYDFIPDKQGKFDFNPETKKANIEKYARRMLSRKQIASKSNVPIDLTPDDLAKAETDARSKYGGTDMKKARKKYTRRKPKVERQIVVNPNKRQQQRKTIETLRQTNRNRTVSDVRTSPKTEVIRKPKVERDIKSFIDKTKQNRELQRQSRTNIFTKNNQTTRTTTKPLTGQDLKKQIEKIKTTIPKVEPPKVEKPVKQFNGKSFDAFMKDSERKRKQTLQSVKNIKVDPVTKFGSKVSVGNQIPFVQPGPKRIPNPERVKKIKDYRAMLKSQPKYLRNISKVGRKVPGRYKALGVALGTLGAIYGTSKLVGSGTKPKTTPLVAGGGKDNFVPVSAKINLSKGTRPTFYTKDPSGSGKSIPFKQAFPNAGKVKNT